MLYIYNISSLRVKEGRVASAYRAFCCLNKKGLKISQLMMFSEIIAVRPEIMQKTLSTLHGKNV